MIRCLQFLFIATCLVCVSGCLPVGTSWVIAYNSAVSKQEHAAYTDYYFSVLDNNLRQEKQGLSPNPVMPEEKWLVEEHRPRLEYTKYYDDIITENAKTNESAYVPKTMIPFDEWKTNEYKQILAERLKSFQTPSQQGR
jgi:hypothetical protein